jgi:hypothetical protein
MRTRSTSSSSCLRRPWPTRCWRWPPPSCSGATGLRSGSAPPAACSWRWRASRGSPCCRSYSPPCFSSCCAGQACGTSPPVPVWWWRSASPWPNTPPGTSSTPASSRYRTTRGSPSTRVWRRSPIVRGFLSRRQSTGCARREPRATGPAQTSTCGTPARPSSSPGQASTPCTGRRWPSRSPGRSSSGRPARTSAWPWPTRSGRFRPDAMPATGPGSSPRTAAPRCWPPWRSPA